MSRRPQQVDTRGQPPGLADDLLAVDRRAHRSLTEAARVVPSALAEAPCGQVVVLDVTGMTEVNRRHGTDVGDRALDAVEAALREGLPGGVVARLAGDQFVVVVPRARPDDPVEETVLRAVRKVRVRGRRGRQVRVTARAGTACWRDGPSRREALPSAGARLGR